MGGFLRGEEVTRISITIPKSVLSKVHDVMGIAGMDSRSKFISIALDNYVARLSWVLGRGHVAGSVVLIYDHERGEVAKRVTHVQHEHLDIVRSSLHVHLDEHNCLEMLCVVGDVERVKSLIASLERIAGLKGLDYAFFRTGE